MADSSEICAFRASVRLALGLAPAASRRRRSARFLHAAAVAALLWGLASRPAAAQPRYVQEPVQGLASFDVGAGSAPTVVDLDADGDLDIVEGERGGTLVYLKNTGSSSAPAFVEVTGAADPFAGIDVGFFSHPDLADLDGDGDLDAVVGEVYATLRYFANTGSSTSPSFVERLGSQNPFSGIIVSGYSIPDLADLDADGDLDAVVGEYFGTVRFYENTGSSALPAFVARTGSANPFNGVDIDLFSFIDLADLDGDGDRDGIIGDGFNSLHYAENTGSSTAPAFVEVFGTENPFEGFGSLLGAPVPALVDFDGDGDFDAIVGEFWGTLDLLVNTGTSSMPAFVAAEPPTPFFGFDAGFDSVPELADLDGDGDLDLIVGAGDGTLRYFENTGSAVAFSFVQRTGTANPLGSIDVGNTSCPKLVDLDGDGDLDAVVGESSGTLRYFQNSGSSTAPAFIELTGSANPMNGLTIMFNSSPELADLDGDGDFDMVVGSTFSEFHYFENTGTSTMPRLIERLGSANPFDGIDDVVGEGYPELVDFDGDGDLDCILSWGDGGLKYFATLVLPARRFSSSRRGLPIRSPASTPATG
ncbi:MAG: VCBS repeat-containing protein [Thermoanaerobaculia bacterium]|nr:VCBS repeat-containing protein [Thermoanaerobaculia bacterium]